MKHLAYLAALLPTVALAQTDPADWDAVTAAAEGQTVYWNAWGGSTTTNDFIAWVGERVAEDYGVTLEHVKLTDTADAVTRVLSEKQAGEDDDGAIDHRRGRLLGRNRNWTSLGLGFFDGGRRKSTL